MGRERGAVAVSFLLLVAVLLAFAGLGMDVARVYVSRTELQNAADACALAASSALSGANTDQLALAESYGITAGTRNKIGMQKIAPTMAVNASVTFSDSPTGPFLVKSAVAASAVTSVRYVRCTLSEPSVPTLLLQVASAVKQTVTPITVSAQATAGLQPSSSSCAMPLAICKKAGASAPNYGYATGEWLVGRLQPSANTMGKFKWVNYPDYATVKDLAQMIAQGGQCNLFGTPMLTPAQGNINSLAESWNWRFGISKGSGAPAGAYAPDLTGFAYVAANWSSQTNAYPDFIKQRALHSPWNNQPALSGGWKASPQSVHLAGGDRRMVVGPVVDCSTWNSGGATAQPILGWACFLMLNPAGNPTSDPIYIEYRGTANGVGSGCVSAGAPGGPGSAGPSVPALVQ